MLNLNPIFTIHDVAKILEQDVENKLHALKEWHDKEWAKDRGPHDHYILVTRDESDEGTLDFGQENISSGIPGIYDEDQQDFDGISDIDE